MGTSTILNPIFLGSVKNTTDPSTAGKVRNVGAVAVTQSVPLVASSTVTCVIPAGSLVQGAYLYASTAGSPTTAVNLTIGGTVVGTLSCAQGLNSLTVTAAAVGTLANVGSSDVFVSFACPSAIVGYLVINYVVRNADGTTTIPYTQA